MSRKWGGPQVDPQSTKDEGSEMLAKHAARPRHTPPPPLAWRAQVQRAGAGGGREEVCSPQETFPKAQAHPPCIPDSGPASHLQNERSRACEQHRRSWVSKVAGLGRVRGRQEKAKGVQAWRKA